jgi:hypothetical protein
VTTDAEMERLTEGVQKLTVESAVEEGSFAHAVLQKVAHEMNKHDHSGDLLVRLERRLNNLVLLNTASYAKTSDGKLIQVRKALLPQKEYGNYNEDWWEVEDAKTGEIFQLESKQLTPIGPLQVLAELACD